MVRILPMLSVIGFASGSPLSLAVMSRIARTHRLKGVVLPRGRSRFMEPLRRMMARWRSPLGSLGVPLLDMVEVRSQGADVIVVASFPAIIPAPVIESARLGAFNVHMSLLPKHRGIDPIFGTYWHDDAEAGVTTHWMTSRLDAGDIAARQSVPLPRGFASRELYMRLVGLAVDQLQEVLTQLSAGSAARERQDDSKATYISQTDINTARVPFGLWPAERVWHVLSGLGDQRSGLVENSAGQPIAHGRATAYRITEELVTGRMELSGATAELHCSDGIVSLALR